MQVQNTRLPQFIITQIVLISEKMVRLFIEMYIENEFQKRFYNTAINPKNIFLEELFSSILQCFNDLTRHFHHPANIVVME